MREAWRLLRVHHPELIDDIADGRRFVWLGSGISREQVPDLVELIRRVLLFLRDRAASSEPDAQVHRNALLEILNDHLSAEEPRYLASPEDWEPGDLDHLRESYSRILGVGVVGKPNDYLLIDGAALPNLYGNPALEPGPTHTLLAVLISEGVLPNLASGNWDGLVEKALETISGTRSLLDVYVDVNDPRSANGHAEIAKFHGCAVLTLTESARYRDKIIATSAQISRLHGDDTYAHMRDRLRHLTTSARSLVLGLSVQDSDLLAIFKAAANRSPWPWDSAHPAYLFAEPSVLPTQRDVLEVAYGDDFGRERPTILSRSALGTYAGPMTAAIVLEVLSAKFVAALRHHQGLPTDVYPVLEQGIHRLVLKIVATHGDSEASIAAFLLGGYADFLRSYFGLGTDAGTYIAFARGTRIRIGSDIATTAMGIDLLSAAVGLIGFGERTGRWRVALTEASRGTLVSISRPRAQTMMRLVVVRGAREAIAVMTTDDWIQGHGAMVLLQMDVGAPPSPRSSAGRIGRGRASRARRELTWSEISDSIENLEDLMSRFETGIGL